MPIPPNQQWEEEGKQVAMKVFKEVAERFP